MEEEEGNEKEEEEEKEEGWTREGGRGKCDVAAFHRHKNDCSQSASDHCRRGDEEEATVEKEKEDEEEDEKGVGRTLSSPLFARPTGKNHEPCGVAEEGDEQEESGRNPNGALSFSRMRG